MTPKTAPLILRKTTSTESDCRTSMKDHRKKKKAKLALQCLINANRLKVDKLASRNIIKSLINYNVQVVWPAKRVIKLEIRKWYKNIGWLIYRLSRQWSISQWHELITIQVRIDWFRCSTSNRRSIIQVSTLLKWTAWAISSCQTTQQPRVNLQASRNLQWTNQMTNLTQFCKLLQSQPQSLKTINTNNWLNPASKMEFFTMPKPRIHLAIHLRI